MTPKSIRALTFLMFGVFWITPRPALACDCVPSPLPTSLTLDRYSETLLVVGKVIGQRLVGESGVVVEIQLQISETFLNPSPSDRVTVYTQLSGVSCYGYPFQIGHDYLISTILSDSLDPKVEALPNVVPRGSHVVPLCGALNLRTRAAQERLQAIRAVAPKPVR
jgi:hypothetical protein